jgi:hypothetical protein
MTIFDREQVTDIFRQRVLEALDEAARETFDPPGNRAGATDADLPRLFTAIDAQIDVLAERFGDILIEPVLKPKETK